MVLSQNSIVVRIPQHEKHGPERNVKRQSTRGTPKWKNDCGASAVQCARRVCVPKREQLTLLLIIDFMETKLLFVFRRDLLISPLIGWNDPHGRPADGLPRVGSDDRSL
jgi:hypothetical protein